MSRTFHHGERQIRVRGVRREDPDLRKLARALIEIVQAEAEAEAEREHKEETSSATVWASPSISALDTPRLTPAALFTEIS